MSARQSGQGLVRRPSLLRTGAVVVAALATAATASGQTPLRKMGEMDLRLVGIEARPDPAQLVVPRNVATGIRIEFLAGGQPMSLAEAVRFLGPAFSVSGELSGPGLPGALTVPLREEGDPLPADPLLLELPALQLSGNYRLANLRVMSRGMAVLDVTPSEVPIRVIEQILITSVTTRALSLDEIRQKGIVLDSDDYLAFEFTLGLLLESKVVPFTMPVVFDRQGVPIPQPLETPGAPPRDRVDVPGGFPPPTLYPLLLEGVDDAGQPLNLPGSPYGQGEIRIPSLLVIPGNVGYLKQFFSAQLFVANGAPAGSGLTVRDVFATIALPPGEDAEAGTADDPLALPELSGGTQPLTMQVKGLGHDGEAGTSDDTESFRPGEQGTAEFLLRGEKEGFHSLGFDIAAELHGLPTGPIGLRGKASGGVVVRNPYFDLSFTVPSVVRRGEKVDVYATLTNIGKGVANLVTVGLDMDALSLNTLELESDPEQTIDTLAPGNSATVLFTFRAQATGKVVATYLRTEGVGAGSGNVRFSVGLGERGVPLSPDTLGLPQAAYAVPPEVLEAAMRVLGQAWSIANAPAGTLPKDVLRISREVVTAKALALTEAGLRILLGQSEQKSMEMLGFDLFAGTPRDAGWSQLLATTEAGQELAQAFGGSPALEEPVGGGGPDLEAAVVVGPETIDGAGPMGFHAALLFDRILDPASVTDVSLYTIPKNAVRTARTQLSGRFVFLTLEQPEGNILPTTVSVSGVRDRSGRSGGGTRGLMSRLEDTAALVTGRVLSPHGEGISGATVIYVNTLGTECRYVAPKGFASVATDAHGRYEFRHVRRGDCGPISMVTQDDQGAKREVDAWVRTDGETITLDIVRQGRGSVAGVVSLADASGVKTPVAGARVSALSAADNQSGGTAVTDAAGEYRIDGLTVGAVTVHATSGIFAGHTPGRVEYAGTTTSIDVELIAGSVTVSGTVYRVTDGEERPFPGVFVAYQLVGGPVVAFAESDAEGHFEIRGMPPGLFNLWANALQRIVRTDDILGEAHATLTGQNLVFVDEDPDLWSTLSGRVFLSGSERAPAAGAVVWLGRGGTLTDDEGAFTLSVPRRPYVQQTVNASTRDSLRAGKATFVANGPTATPVEITLSGLATARFRVLAAGPTATPVSGAEVSLITYCQDPCGCLSRKTDANGYVTFTELPLGVVVAQAVHTTGLFKESARGQVTLTEDDGISQGEIHFAGSGTADGTVRPPDGVSMSGANVQVYSNRFVKGNDLGLCGMALGLSHSGRTGQDGRFEFTGVGVGKVRVVASHEILPKGVGEEKLLAAPGDTVRFDLVLVDTVAKSFGGVVFHPDGETLVGAGVKVSIEGPLPAVTVATNASGEYHFAKNLLPAGRYDLTATDPSTGATVRQKVAVRAGEDHTMNLRLLGRGRVEVQVRDALGGWIENALVRLTATDYPNQEMEAVLDPSNQGTAVFPSVFEGDLVVQASDLFGRGGRAAVAMPEGAEVVQATVVLNPTGTVVGQFQMPQPGATPIANASVVLKAGGRKIGQVTTDSSGSFSFAFVPAGELLALEGQDPLTGRKGHSFGTIAEEGQTLILDLVAEALGSVTGTVTQDGAVVPAIEVKVTSGSFSLSAFTDEQGVYQVTGVPSGIVTVSASWGGSFAGSATGVLASEGETLTIPVALRSSGRVSGTIVPASGAPPLSSVVFRGVHQVSTVSAPDGSFAFARVPAGKATLTAQSLSGIDVGRTSITVPEGGELEGVEIPLNGVGSISGEARGSDTAPTAGKLVIQGTGAERYSHTLYLASDGAFSLPEVLAGPFTAQLTVGTGSMALHGLAEGVIEAGQLASLVVQVEDSRPVSGTVVRADDVTPAHGTLVSLRQGNRKVQVQAGRDGMFRIDGVPLGSFTLSFEDPLSEGVAFYESEGPGSNQTLVDVGIVRLDESDFAVASVTPADGAADVAVIAPVTVTFSQPILPSSLSGITLKNGTANVSVTRSHSADERSVTLTGTWPDSKLLTVSVAASVTDKYDRKLIETFTSQFRTVDLSGPKVVATIPPPNAIEVPLEASLTFTFDEPLGPATGLDSLVTGLAGTTTLDDTATVATFVPAVPLSSNATYSVVVAGAVDREGNHQVGSHTLVFKTLDTIPPVVAFTHPARWSRSARPLVRAALSDTGSGISLTSGSLHLDGSPVAATRSTSAISFAPPFDLAEGEHTAAASAKDLAGNPSAASHEFGVDLTPPLAPELLGVVSDQILTKAVVVSVLPEDALSGVAKVDFLRGGSLFASATAPPWEVTFNLPADGDYLLTARVTDKAGNVGPAGAPVRVIVDRTTVPLDLYDGNDIHWKIDAAGRISLSRFEDELPSPRLSLVREGVTAPFTGPTFLPGEPQYVPSRQGKREVVLEQRGLLGLDVTRRVFVPQTGYFVRYLDLLHNPGAEAVSIDVLWETAVRPSVGVVAPSSTSSGDLQVGADDRSVVLDDADTTPVSRHANPASTLPPTAIVLAGEGGTPPSSLVLVARAEDVAALEAQWSAVTIPAGGTVGLLHLLSAQEDQDRGAAAAARLIQLPPEVLPGLSATEAAAVLNFDVPTDLQSSVEPLTALDGVVTAQTLAGDGVTPVSAPNARFQSASPYYGRSRVVAVDAAGRVSVTARTLAGGHVDLVPREAFSLSATATAFGVSSTADASGDLGIGSPAQVELVFRDTGVLHVDVRRADETAVEGASVALSAGSAPQTRTADTQGRASFVLVPSGPATVTATHPAGSPSVTVPVPVVASTAQTIPVVFDALGEISGVVQAKDGVEIAATVTLTAPGLPTRSTTTQPGSKYSFSDLPPGSYTLTARDLRSQVVQTATVIVVGGAVTEGDFTMPPVGRVVVTVRSGAADGPVVPSALVWIWADSRDTDFVQVGQTDSMGLLEVNNVPGPTVRVQAQDSRQTEGAKVASPELALAQEGDVVNALVVLPSLGSVEGIARSIDGSAMGSVTVSAVSDSDERELGEQVADAEGAFALTQVEVGAVRLRTEASLTACSATVVSRAEAAGGAVSVEEPLQADALVAAGALATGQVHFWEVSATADTPFTVYSVGSPVGESAALAYPSLQVYRPDGQHVASAASWCTGVVRVSVTPTVSGPYLIRAGGGEGGCRLAVTSTSTASTVLRRIEPRVSGTVITHGGPLDFTVSVPYGNMVMSTKVDGSGRYALPLLGAGPFTVTVKDSSNARVAEATIEPPSGESHVLDLVVPDRESVTVTVTRQGSIVTTPSLEVVLKSDHPTALPEDAQRTLRTSSGVTPAVFMPVGLVTAQVYDAKYGETVEVPQQLVLGAPLDLVLALSEITTVVTGRVLARDGVTPLEGAVVKAEWGGPETTDAQGHYAMVVTGREQQLSVSYTSSQGRSYSRAVSITPTGGALEQTVVLSVPILRGIVTEPGGTTPAAGAHVEACGPVYGSYSWYTACIQAVTGASGEYAFHGLPKWGVYSTTYSYTVDVTVTARAAPGASGFASATFSYHDAITPTRTVNLTLPLTGHLTGQVMDAHDLGVSEATVSLQSPPGATIATTSAGPDGSFAFDYAPVGAVRIFAKDADGIPGEAEATVVEAQTLHQAVALVPATTVDLTLSRDGALLAHELEVAALDAPVETVPDPMIPWRRTVTTRSDAPARIRIPAGTYRIRFSGAYDYAAGAYAGYAAAEGFVPPDTTTALPLTWGSHVEQSTLAGDAGAYCFGSNCGGTSAVTMAVSDSVRSEAEGSPVIGQVEMEGQGFRTLTTRARSIRTWQRHFVPSSGAFARRLTFVTNPTAAAVDLTFSSLLEQWGRSIVVASSDGDASFQATDAWVIVQDEGQTETAVIVGPLVTSAGLEATSQTGEGGVEWSSRLHSTTSLSLAPGATKALLTYTISWPAGDTVALAALAESLASLSAPDALEGVTPEERSAVVNFLPLGHTTVSGLVHDASGLPVPGALVGAILPGRTTLATATAQDASGVEPGRFDLTGVVPMALTVVGVDPVTNRPGRLEVDVPDVPSLEIGVVTLLPESALGTVRVEIASVAAAGSTVELTVAAFSPFWKVAGQLDDNGGITFEGVPAGDVRVSSVAGVLQGTLSPGGVLELMSGRRGPGCASVTGTVVDENWSGLPGIRVGAWDDVGLVAEGTTDSEGRFTLLGLEEKDYTVQGFDPQTGRLTWPHNTPVDWGCTEESIGEILLVSEDSTGAIAVTGVLEATGAPLAHVRVRLRQETDLWQRTIVLDANGQGTFTGVSEGYHTVSADLPAPTGGWAATSVQAGATAHVVLRVGERVDALFPVNLTGTNGIPLFVQSSGRTSSTEDYEDCSSFCSGQLGVDGSWPAYQLPFGRLLQDGREVGVAAYTRAGIEMAVRTFVPLDGRFVRLVQTIRNTTDEAVSIEANVWDDAEGTWTVPSTSSGDADLDPADDHASFTSSDVSLPGVAFVFRNGGAPVPGDGTTWSSGEGWGSLVSTWQNVALEPGQSVLLMRYMVKRPHGEAEDLNAQVQALADLTDPDALSGLTFEERAAIINFNIPAGLLQR